MTIKAGSEYKYSNGFTYRINGYSKALGVYVGEYSYDGTRWTACIIPKWQAVELTGADEIKVVE